MNHRHCVIVMLVVCSTLAAVASADQNVSSQRRAALPRTAGGARSEPQADARSLAYSPHDVPRIKTKVRYTTLIILPKTEVILDFVCGDKDLWVINGEQNFAYVKPAREHSQTNLNLITESGNVYSFVLSEVSGATGGSPDLKVFIEPKEPATGPAAAASRRFVSAQELDQARRELEVAKEDTRQAKDACKAAIDAGISRFVTNVRFVYRFEAGKRPFYVRAMYHDDHFTYIQARPEETPTLYEVKDSKPNLVSFEYKNGVYVAGKILDSGYLAVGKQRLKFTREE